MKLNKSKEEENPRFYMQAESLVWLDEPVWKDRSENGRNQLVQPKKHSFWLV